MSHKVTFNFEILLISKVVFIFIFQFLSCRWQSVVESSYMLHVVPPAPLANMDSQSVEKLSTPPPNWSMEADEELVRFLVEHSKGHETSIGGASKYVSSVIVSTVSFSYCDMKNSDFVWSLGNASFTLLTLRSLIFHAPSLHKSKAVVLARKICARFRMHFALISAMQSKAFDNS